MITGKHMSAYLSTLKSGEMVCAGLGRVVHNVLKHTGLPQQFAIRGRA
jgi:hypothetical protein